MIDARFKKGIDTMKKRTWAIPFTRHLLCCLYPNAVCSAQKSDLRMDGGSREFGIKNWWSPSGIPSGHGPTLKIIGGAFFGVDFSGWIFFFLF